MYQNSMKEDGSKKKSMLMLASVASMIDQFNMSNIEILLKLGYKVDVACNFKEGNTCSTERIEDLKHRLTKMKVAYYQIDFTRNVMNFLQDIKAYNQVKKLVLKKKYDFIHCHSPIGGVIGRAVAHEVGIKVIYTAHGFHFYDGAPKKNWIIYYPIEKFFSKWTDILITINKEDYSRAKKKFYANKVVYIPGVGLDTEKFEQCNIDRCKKRESLNIPDDGFVLLSVGELQNRKNQRTVIDALGKLRNRKIYYLVVGRGELYEEYDHLIRMYGLQDNIKLLGYRTDIDELCKITDCFVHPSVREGLGIAPLEAMASGLPLISSYVNGIKDYTENEVSGCCLKNPTDVEEMVEAIEKVYKKSDFRIACGRNNKVTAKSFDIKNTNKIMEKLYKEI